MTTNSKPCEGASRVLQDRAHWLRHHDEECECEVCSISDPFELVDPRALATLETSVLVCGVDEILKELYALSIHRAAHHREAGNDKAEMMWNYTYAAISKHIAHLCDLAAETGHQAGDEELHEFDAFGISDQ